MTSLAPYANVSESGLGAYHAGEGHVLLKRGNVRKDGTVRGIMAAHAAGQIAQNANMWAPSYVLGYRWPFLMADYGDPAVVSGTTSGPYNWGNDNAISRAAEVYTMLTSVPTGTSQNVGAKSGKVGLFGGSMAGLVLLNWARQNPTLVGCVGLCAPAMNLNGMYQGNLGGYRASIAAAYGITYPTPIPSLTAHSPLDGTAADFIGFPIRIWTADDDAIAVNTAAAQTWAAAVNAAGGNVTVTSMGNVGHDPTAVDPDQVLEFFRLNMPA